MKFEDPIQFNPKKELNTFVVNYSNLMEISQGGPLIGDLSINGELIKGYRFGGPCLIYDEFVYAPVYVKKIFGTGFKLSKTYMPTLKVIPLGKTRNLIFLKKIEDGKAFFFEDLEKTIIRYLEIE